MRSFTILSMLVFAQIISTSSAAPKVNLPAHAIHHNLADKPAKAKEPSAEQVLTKESVDALLDSISPQCKAEMEGALDTQWELTPACRTEVQAQLSAVSGVDARAGVVLPEAVQMNLPPGYDPSIKPPLPPKPPKLEREMRRAQRDLNKNLEQAAENAHFATQVGLLVVVVVVVVVVVGVFVCRARGGVDVDDGSSSGAGSGGGKRKKGAGGELRRNDSDGTSWMDSNGDSAVSGAGGGDGSNSKNSKKKK